MRAIVSCFLLTGLLASCAAPAATPSPAATAAPSPAAEPLGTLSRALDPGTYRLDPSVLDNEPIAYPGILITVPRGWANLNGWIVNRPSGFDVPPVAIQFWSVDKVYAHPCQWQGSLFQPGPTVEDLANALVGIPMHDSTQPLDVVIDGYAGKYLVWSVPADLEMDGTNFADCDATVDGIYHDFNSWTGSGKGVGRHHQAPGQIDRVWILDLDGARLVIDAFEMPYATDAERAELTQVVEGIRFEP